MQRKSRNYKNNTTNSKLKEQELSDVKQKLDALQGPNALKAKSDESTHETEATVKQADEGKVQLSSVALLSLK